MLTAAKAVCCSLKTVGGDRIWKSPIFTVKKHVLHHCARMGKNKIYFKIAESLLLPPKHGCKDSAM